MNQNIPKHLNNSNKDNKLHFKIQYISSTHKHSNIVYKSSKVTNLNNYSVTHFKLESWESYIKFLNTDITNTENGHYTQVTVRPWRKVFPLHLNPSQGQQTLVLREKTVRPPLPEACRLHLGNWGDVEDSIYLETFTDKRNYHNRERPCTGWDSLSK